MPPLLFTSSICFTPQLREDLVSSLIQVFRLGAAGSFLSERFTRARTTGMLFAQQARLSDYGNWLEN